MSWVPVLTGEYADWAHRAVTAIAEDLKNPPPAWIPSGRAEEFRIVRGASLWRGRAGVAVLYGYLGECGFGEEWDDWALDYLQECRRVAAEYTMAPSLYRGFLGIAWTLEYLRERLIDDPEDSLNREIDQVLLDHVAESPWTADWEMWTGLVGFGQYALERLPRAEARATLEHVVGHLRSLAEESADGLAWANVPESPSASNRKSYNLGLAHGQACVIGFLVRAYAAGVARDLAQEMIEGSVRWMLARRVPDEHGLQFPQSLTEGADPLRGIQAWCYGDPGVCTTLLMAARVLDRPDWEGIAREHALQCARRVHHARPNDAGFCHGAAGYAYQFNRLFQATGEEELRQAAVHWYRRVADYERPGEGVGGFSSWNRTDDRSTTWLHDPGLVQGSAGIALCLAAAIRDKEPTWDRVLLTNVSPLSDDTARRALVASATREPEATLSKPIALPAELREDRFFVRPVTETGRPCRFYTDTGGGGFFSPAAAEDLATDGAGASTGIRLPRFRPEAWIPTYPHPIQAFGVSEDVHDYGVEPLDGMLGAKWFAGRVWRFDYGARRLELCHPDFRPSEGVSIPLGLSQDDEGRRTGCYPRIDVEIDGETIPMLLDTGAMIRLTSTAATGLGLPANHVQATSFLIQSQFERLRSRHPDWRTIEQADANAGGEPMLEVPAVRFAGAEFGPIWFTRRPDANFVERMSRWTDRTVEGALGGNALKFFRFTLDYPRAVGIFQPVVGAGRRSESRELAGRS